MKKIGNSSANNSMRKVDGQKINNVADQIRVWQMDFFAK